MPRDAENFFDGESTATRIKRFEGVLRGVSEAVSELDARIAERVREAKALREEFWSFRDALIGGPMNEGGARGELGKIAQKLDNFITIQDAKKSAEIERMQKNAFWNRLITTLVSIGSLILAYYVATHPHP